MGNTTMGQVLEEDAPAEAGYPYEDRLSDCTMSSSDEMPELVGDPFPHQKIWQGINLKKELSYLVGGRDLSWNQINLIAGSSYRKMPELIGFLITILTRGKTI
jgi:hypothetical protein